MKKYCFGIDVGGTSIKCGLFRMDGALEEKWEIPTKTENQGESILPDIAASILQKMQEKQISKEAVSGVGIGIPGPGNEKGEVPCAVNLNWGLPDFRQKRAMTPMLRHWGKRGEAARKALPM